MVTGLTERWASSHRIRQGRQLRRRSCRIEYVSSVAIVSVDCFTSMFWQRDVAFCTQQAGKSQRFVRSIEQPRIRSQLERRCNPKACKGVASSAFDALQPPRRL